MSVAVKKYTATFADNKIKGSQVEWKKLKTLSFADTRNYCVDMCFSFFFN